MTRRSRRASRTRASPGTSGATACAAAVDAANANVNTAEDARRRLSPGRRRLHGQPAAHADRPGHDLRTGATHHHGQRRRDRARVQRRCRGRGQPLPVRDRRRPRRVRRGRQHSQPRRPAPAQHAGDRRARRARRRHREPRYRARYWSPTRCRRATRRSQLGRARRRHLQPPRRRPGQRSQSATRRSRSIRPRGEIPGRRRAGDHRRDHAGRGHDRSQPGRSGGNGAAGVYSGRRPPTASTLYGSLDRGQHHRGQAGSRTAAARRRRSTTADQRRGRQHLRVPRHRQPRPERRTRQNQGGDTDVSRSRRPGWRRAPCRRACPGPTSAARRATQAGACDAGAYEEGAIAPAIDSGAFPEPVLVPTPTPQCRHRRPQPSAQEPTPVVNQTVVAREVRGTVKVRLPRQQPVRRPRRRAGHPGRLDRRHQARARSSSRPIPKAGRRAGEGGVPRRHLPHHAVARDHRPQAHRGARACPKRAPAPPSEAEDAQAVGQGHGQVPHDRQLQRRDDPRHRMARPGHVHGHAHTGQAGRRRPCATRSRRRRSSCAPRASGTWREPAPLVDARSFARDTRGRLVSGRSGGGTVKGGDEDAQDTDDPHGGGDAAAVGGACPGRDVPGHHARPTATERVRRHGRARASARRSRAAARQQRADTIDRAGGRVPAHARRSCSSNTPVKVVGDGARTTSILRQREPQASACSRSAGTTATVSGVTLPTARGATPVTRLLRRGRRAQSSGTLTLERVRVTGGHASQRRRRRQPQRGADDRAAA